MREIYRKRGYVVRWENGTLVRVSESGIAIEEGELFTCEPEHREALWLSDEHVLATVETIRAIDVNIERLIVSHGIAEHEFDGRTWTEETHRVHLSIVNGRIRALIDSLDDVERVANAMKRVEQQEREAPKHLVLAPNVSAALLPSLPNVDQMAGGVDGKGHDIGETFGENWYRPSYRVRPIRMPLNLRLRTEKTGIDPDLPRAVALLAPPDGLTVRVLIDDGTRVYPATVHAGRIEAVSETVTWYPYAGGSFGAEMML
ncbi:MAG: hypothetical protein DMF56_04470 [Acidobacteria bacterium]|nr:MAG: hypothetical protein DMF56_04470 [Acidobacteriota bacterium]